MGFVTWPEQPMVDDVDELEAADEPTLSARSEYFFALADVPQPGRWARFAACRTAPKSIFFVGRGESLAPARAICSSCGVRDQCLEYAIDAGHDLKGVWAGTSERDRRRLIVARRRGEEVAPEPVAVEPRARKTPTPPGHIYETLVALTEHPDRWALIVSYPAAHSASAMASLLRHGHKKSPPGAWTFEGRVNDDGGSDLYARYDGPAAEVAS